MGSCIEPHLRKEYKFQDFKETQDFVTSVGDLAEQQWHHPDICFGWGRAEVTIWTHRIDGLTESDFILAAKIDALNGSNGWRVIWIHRKNMRYDALVSEQNTNLLNYIAATVETLRDQIANVREQMATKADIASLEKKWQRKPSSLSSRTTLLASRP